METFINDAMVIEGALLSFFLALWMTWLGLSGLSPAQVSLADTCGGRSSWFNVSSIILSGKVSSTGRAI